MINLNHTLNPYLDNMPVKQRQTKQTRKRRREAEQERLDTKARSPGVPPNTCPYIDVVQTMIQDLVNSYDDLRSNNHHNPLVENIGERAKDTLEYIRTANETLRDNSAFWYQQYKNKL